MHRLPLFETFSAWLDLELLSNAIAVHSRTNNTNRTKKETKNKRNKFMIINTNFCIVLQKQTSISICI